MGLTSGYSFPIIHVSDHGMFPVPRVSTISGKWFLMKQKFLLGFSFLLLGLAAGCLSRGSDLSAPCSERQALFCEDFEGTDPALGGNQMVSSTATDQWWITGDDDQEYLFPDFPLSGRSPNNMILLSGGTYDNLSASFLYTREIDLSSATRASLGYNLIYRTEKHWDGLLVFAVAGGIAEVENPDNWIALTPAGEYPDSVLLNGSLVPGYSGISSGWIHQEVDLSSFLGQKLILGFYFVSDDYLGEWGIGLDDIVVEADSGDLSSQIFGLVDLAVDSLHYPYNTMILTDLPRANPLAPAACIGATEDQPELSERAIIKAVSEAGEHVLVLHPEAGTLCWVRQEDIWIDGDPAKLPRIAEIALKNYLPISPMGQTPVLADPGCLTELESPLPIRIQSALIEHGEIIRLLFDPLLPSEIDIPPSERRVGSPQEFPEVLENFSPGGELWIEGQGKKTSCLADWSQPGRVICGGLDLDISLPLRFEVCWQGWSENQSCPIGYSMDPSGTNCYPVEETSGCPLSCLPGYSLDSQTKTCLVDRSGGTFEEDLYKCPAGFLYNSLVGRCLGQEYLTETNCPPAMYFVAEDNQCMSIDQGSGCPEGYLGLEDPETCIPATFSAAPHCVEFDLEFPRSEITVKESTRCLKDPENSNEMVSSLKPFDSVEVLGVSEDGEMLVVNNPTYQIPCWAPLTDFYLDTVDLRILPVISNAESD